MNLPLPLPVLKKKHRDALQRLSKCVYTRVSGSWATFLEGVKDEMADGAVLGDECRIGTRIRLAVQTDYESKQ
jgi:hypothetical protein